MKKLTIAFIVLDLLVAICFFVVYGPFETFRNTIITTAISTKTHDYIAYTFYSEEKVREVLDLNSYVPLTDDLLLRKKRFVYGSVIYVQEASLVADSQLIRDMDINERLMLFNKLIGHETKGGVIIYDTHSRFTSFNTTSNKSQSTNFRYFKFR